MSKQIEKDRDICLFIGDFNDVLCNEEKEEGNYRMTSSMRDFREFVARNELMDLGYKGYPFTWRNNREALPIQQRLDHGLSNLGWHDLYPDTKIRHVVLEGSDHALLFLSTKKVNAWRGIKFTYDAWWSKMEECRDLRDKFGSSHTFRFCKKMKTLRRSLNAWYKGRGRNSKKVIEQLKEEIRVAYNSNGFAMEEVKQKERELKDAHKEEEAYWRAKSRIQ